HRVARLGSLSDARANDQGTGRLRESRRGAGRVLNVRPMYPRSRSALGSRTIRIAFTYNVRHVAGGLVAVAQEQAEFDEPETIAAIHDAIEANGHECVDVEADDDCFAALLELKPSI